MKVIIGSCLVLLLIALRCEGHVLREQRQVHVPSITASTTLTSLLSTLAATTTMAPTPSNPEIVTDCGFNILAECTDILSAASLANSANATDENTYAQNICSNIQSAVTCLEGINSTCSSVNSTLDLLRYQLKLICQHEGSCRLAEPLYCVVKEAPNFPQDMLNLCQNLHSSVVPCVEESLSRRGCTSQNYASRYWTLFLTSMEPLCFNSPSPNPPACDFPVLEDSRCKQKFLQETIPSLLTDDFSGLCGELDPLKTCLRNLKPSLECSEAEALVDRLISLYDRALVGACTPVTTPPSCRSHGNVYSVVPNTLCTEFTQSVNGVVEGKQRCPLGTLFDTRDGICVCNHAALVHCIV